MGLQQQLGSNAPAPNAVQRVAHRVAGSSVGGGGAGEDPPPLDKITARLSGGRGTARVSAYPTLLLAISRGFGAYWFRTEPLTAESTHVSIEALVLPEYADDDGVAREMLASVDQINAEDIVINEQTAAGLRSKYASAGRVSDLEGSPWHFRRWLLGRLA